MLRAALLPHFLGDGAGARSYLLKLSHCFRRVGNIFMLLGMRLQGHFLRFNSCILSKTVHSPTKSRLVVSSWFCL